MTENRDHGGGLDAAVARWGGTRAGWLDLSTGINPVPYPVPDLGGDVWTALPDRAAMSALEAAARAFWNIPKEAGVVAANGASALIARMPDIVGTAPVYIPAPTYNEHAAAFAAQGMTVSATDPACPVHVLVHPNNPDGRMWPDDALAPRSSRPWTVIDESFCDVTPQASHIARAGQSGVIVLKSFGKFWGLAGLRLGMMVGTPAECARMTELLGPWPVSGPALQIATRALADTRWAMATRARLAADSARLDAVLTARGARVVGGTTLFRLYDVDDAAAWQDRLAQVHVWSRIFPYSHRWLRLGLPHPDRWAQVEAAV